MIRIRTSRSACLFILFVLISLGTRVNSQSTLVTNKSELEAALLSAGPGDTIVLKDQAWNGITMAINCMGAENDSIVIRPETPGGASMESGSKIEIGGDYIVLEGFKFVRGYITSSPIEFKSGGRDANHCRVTNCLIDNWHPTNTSTKFHWVAVYGSYNRVDHCQFSNMNHVGVTLFVRAGADQPGHHRIDHNYFGPKPEGDGNGYESIKLGGGDYSMYPLYTIVEKNFFYRCDGEVELISNKSWENIYRHNTFYESQGTLTLRWGKKCLIEGNYFIGNGRSNTGGIRITDGDHVIVNNYLENLRGDDARAAISVMSGIPDAEGGDGGHGQTKNAKIMFNTIIGCEESLNVGYWDDDDLNDPRGDITAPENCTIANNIISSTRGPLIKEDWAPSINTTWLANMLHGAPAGIELDTGLILEDPGLVKADDGIMRVTETSPAVNRAEGQFPGVNTDFEMQPRDSTPDIGADEWSLADRLALPIGAEDVGPDWYVAPNDTRAALIKDHSVLVYPNPASDRFFISLGEILPGKLVTVDIFDLSGLQVLTTQFIYNGSDTEIRTGSLKGQHIIRIRTQGNIGYSKVILGK